MTARFAPILWLLQVRDLAQSRPFGSGTPHCFSTSTGALGFGSGLAGFSFFFLGFASLASFSVVRSQVSKTKNGVHPEIRS